MKNNASPHPPAGRRPILALLALCALLAVGCGALPDKPGRATLYDFGPSPAAAAAPASANLPALPPIMLAEIDASMRLESTQLVYRLGYADANELRPYGQARWRSSRPSQCSSTKARSVTTAW